MKCVDCEGKGVCSFCDGEAVDGEGEDCTECDASGNCNCCEGSGELKEKVRD